MNGRIDNDILVNYLFPFITVIVFFFASIYLSPFGLFLSVLIPTPIITTYLSAGERAGIRLIIFILLFIGLFAGLKNGLIFLLEYGAVSIVLAELIKKDYKAEKVVFLTVIFAALLVFAGVMAFLAVNNLNPKEYMIDHVQKYMEDMITVLNEQYQEMNLANEQIESISKLTEKIVKIFLLSLPAWIITSFTIGILINYIAIKNLWIKYKKNQKLFTGESLLVWSPSPNWIWLLIVSGFLNILVNIEVIKVISINVIIVSLLIFILQGVAIISCLLEKYKVLPILRVPIYFLMFLQPIFLLIIAGIGLFDYWIDIRKLRS